MREESSHIANAVGLIAVDGGILSAETLVELVAEGVGDAAETLAEKAIEAEVGALLTAALQNHVAHLRLLAWLELDLEELVGALLEVDTGHDGEVDLTPQLDQIRVASVIDLQGFCRATKNNKTKTENQQEYNT